ncbi:type II toxin-antitoxin system PemK/MazF family toxin [Lysinibacter cavernae]|uniref:mRNA interferase n=1 Tax=Lysinibacter cavernae TaxID=1640652 RepID=A0A7X5R316_9MICO|nr:type II toxin-antitoxin system PemK/MazF family toxin [Lysinibacter cavernae]NIH54753.1 mRNA interferase MazF [Lysinibacter cavernae]
MVIRRGTVVIIDFGTPLGSETAKRRPAVVIQRDELNNSQLATITVAAITSNTMHADRPGNVFLPSTASGLDRDSVVSVTQVSTVDRSRIDGIVGELPEYLIHEIDSGLRMALGV